jgi:hypothetical protein
MYVECGTFEALAAKVGVSRQTVQKWFRRLGLRGTTNKPHALRPEHRSVVARWLRAHPGVALPRSVEKAAALIGISKNTFESYIERRRERVRAYVEALGALSTYPRTLRDDAGKFLPPRAIASVKVHVDRWTLEVQYDGTLKVGTEFTLTLPYAKVIAMWKDAAS